MLRLLELSTSGPRVKLLIASITSCYRVDARATRHLINGAVYRHQRVRMRAYRSAAASIVAVGQRSLHSSTTLRSSPLSRPSTRSGQRSSFHLTTPARLPRKRDFFTSNVLYQDGSQDRKLSASSDEELPTTSSPASSASSLSAVAPPPPPPPPPPPSKRKAPISHASRGTPAMKNSLRRVAIIAQQQPAATNGKMAPTQARHHRSTAADTALISAVCVAEGFDMAKVVRLLRQQQDGGHGTSTFVLDPDEAGFDEGEVVHARRRQHRPPRAGGEAATEVPEQEEDIFVFPSGTLVVWSPLPPPSSASSQGSPSSTAAASTTIAAAADSSPSESVSFSTSSPDYDPDYRAIQVQRTLRPLLSLLAPAAQSPLPQSQLETESLEWATDPASATSGLRQGGDVVVLGTRRHNGGNDAGAAIGVDKGHDQVDRLDTTLAKIAFSSGLARSTKLAVLESALQRYFETTRDLPARMSRGEGRALWGGWRRWLGGTRNQPAGGQAGEGLHLSRDFVTRKTGELLALRAALNHYSELTDSLPDLFWDGPSALGLEAHYDEVGRALDVGVRIRALNQKMDYAQEIAAVLREMASERHATRLEWIIIVLIAVEVAFELRRVYMEHRWASAPTPTAARVSADAPVAQASR